MDRFEQIQTEINHHQQQVERLANTISQLELEVKFSLSRIALLIAEKARLNSA